MDKKFTIICSCGEQVTYNADDTLYASVKKGKLTINTTWEDTIEIQCKCGNKTRLCNTLKIK